MKRDISIRNRKVTFSSRKLKGGKTGYYRDGKRQTSSYGIRIAKAILAGKTLSQARGHDPTWKEWQAKRLTAVDISRETDQHLEAWQEPVRNDKGAKEQRPYYAKVWVTSNSMKRIGSDKQTDEACVQATLRLRDPDSNVQGGFTLASLRARFNSILSFTLESYRLTLCTGDIYRDVVGFWRHST